MKKKSRGLLAFALAFCMTFSAAAPAGAGTFDHAGMAGQQPEQIAEDADVDEALSDGQIQGEDQTTDIGEDGIPGDVTSGDDIGEDGISGEVTPGTDIPGNGIPGDDISGDDLGDIPQQPEEPAVSENEQGTAAEGPSEISSVSEVQSSVSENDTPGSDQDTGSPRWVRVGNGYKAEKPDGSGYYSEADGLVQLKDSEGNLARYAFDADGLMRTGSHRLSVNVDREGVYHFLTAKECTGVSAPSPENSKLGQMVTQTGWYNVTEGSRWLYLEDGVWDQSKTGIQKVADGKTYYLSESDGAIVKNAWKTVSGKTYYFGSNGVMTVSGMKKISGSYYYFDANGVMAANSFVTVSQGKQYYFTSNGKRYEKAGWQRINGSFYYFNKDFSRVIKQNWWKIKENGVTSYYFFDAKGKMYANKLFKQKGYTYYVDSKGRMVTGLRLVNGKRYYFREKTEGKKPLGSAHGGWKKNGGSWYYFNTKTFQAESRELAKISGKYYSFLKSGKMYKGGWKKIGSKLYYFQKQTAKKRNGYAATSGWLKRGKKWYYASAKGSMRTDSWVKSKGKLYYLGTDGVMLANKWIQRDGKWGYLDSNGAFSQRWIKVNGKWKYAQDNGKFAKGWTYIVQNGIRYKYFFNNKGYLLQDVRGRVSGPYMLKVDRRRNQVTVYARDVDGQYNIPVVAMPCSVGLPATPTPTGTFRGTRAGRWQLLMGPSWGQYATLVSEPNGIFIHSVSGAVANPYSLPANEWNKLGREAASHGCIRVAVIDAKWIYENCNGSTIEVRDYAYAGPFDHKTYRQITAAYNWDPTDPAARGYL